MCAATEIVFITVHDSKFLLKLENTAVCPRRTLAGQRIPQTSVTSRGGRLLPGNPQTTPDQSRPPPAPTAQGVELPPWVQEGVSRMKYGQLRTSTPGVNISIYRLLHSPRLLHRCFSYLPTQRNEAAVRAGHRVGEEWGSDGKCHLGTNSPGVVSASVDSSELRCPDSTGGIHCGRGCPVLSPHRTAPRCHRRGFSEKGL